MAYSTKTSMIVVAILLAGCTSKVEMESDRPPEAATDVGEVDAGVDVDGGDQADAVKPMLSISAAETVEEGKKFSFTAALTNMTAGAQATYAWTKVTGPASLPSKMSGATFEVTAPNQITSYNISYRADVTIAGGENTQFTSAARVVDVTADNDAPTAEAAAAQTAAEGDALQLDGSASSDPEGTTITFAWTQTAGPTVTLSSSTAVSPTFTAPDDTSSYQLTFSLVVNDGTQNSTADTVTIAVTAVNPNQIPANHKGQFARACGLDMNRNGIVGEPADCHVCDGVTTDPDGDGQNEDMWYVNSTLGVGIDAPTCGAPVSPCQTIQYAMNLTDGPGVGQEDIICIHGTFDEFVTKTVQGKTVSYIRDGFEYPSQPFMLVGWDYDNDGSYPPFDNDDEAVIDRGNMSRRFLEVGATSYFEMAHLTVQNLSGGGQWDTGVFYADNDFSIPRSHIYLHDLNINNVNAGLSGGTLFNVGYDNAITRYMALENIKASNFGSVFTYFESTAHLSDHFRVAHNTLEPQGPANEAQSMMMHIVSVNDVTIESNFVDVNYASWTPVRSIFVNLGNCSSRVLITKNYLYEASQLLNAFLGNNTCPTITTQDDVTVSYNYLAVQGSGLVSAVTNGYRAVGSPDNEMYAFEDFNVLGNYIVSLPSNTSKICIGSSASNGAAINPGIVRIENNTCIGLGIVLGQSTQTFNQDQYYVHNNIVTGVTAPAYNLAMHSTGTPPSVFSAKNNVYDAAGSFHWLNTDYATLAAWQGAAVSDTNSKVCIPSFLNAGSLNYHLSAADTCAKGFGIAPTILTKDVDGDLFTAPFNIGADQH